MVWLTTGLVWAFFTNKSHVAKDWWSFLLFRKKKQFVCVGVGWGGGRCRRDWPSVINRNFNERRHDIAPTRVLAVKLHLVSMLEFEPLFLLDAIGYGWTAFKTLTLCSGSRKMYLIMLTCHKHPSLYAFWVNYHIHIWVGDNATIYLYVWCHFKSE